MQKYAPEFETRWQEYVKNCHLELSYAEHCRQMMEAGAKIVPPVPGEYRDNRFPVIPVAVPVFIGLKLALARKEKPNLAGRWLKECADIDCSHEYCGRREILFDWRNNRRGGLPIESYILHSPKIGATSQRSTPYDAGLLTKAENERVMWEALPDKFEVIDRGANSDPNFRELISELSVAGFGELISELSAIDFGGDDNAAPDAADF